MTALQLVSMAAIALLGIGASSNATASLDSDPYTYDPTFNEGSVVEDRFAATTTDIRQLAQKLVRLSNGDVVVAGLVPAAFQPNQVDGNFNIGLVRYGADGSRVPWSNPTPAFSYFNEMYLDYPNTSTATYTAVRDIKALNGYLYVLVDSAFSATDSDVVIVAFREDGSYVDTYGAFTTSLSESGAGLTPYTVPNCNGVLSCSKLIATATYNNGARTIITAKRFAVGDDGPPTFNPNGTLFVDTAFGPFGNGANDYAMPDDACASHAQCSVRAVGAAVTRTNSGTPTVYVGAESTWSGDDHDAAVLAVDGASGNAIAGFGIGGGFSWNPIDAGRGNSEVTVGVAVSTEGSDSATDRVYTVSEVELQCLGSRAIGVVKIIGDSGAKDISFGNDGELVFGGDPDPNCFLSSRSDIPFGVALDGTRLAIVGESDWTFGGGGGSLLAIVNATNGHVANMFAQVPAAPNGTPWLAYAPHDVVADGAGRFTSTGYLIDPITIVSLFGTTRFSSDRIFGDGLE